MTMFCYQCEQTAKGQACTVHGVCGKDPQTSALQDLLVYAAEGISMYAHRARELGATDDEVDLFTAEALFATLTNVNFDPESLAVMLKESIAIREKAAEMYARACAAKGVEVEKLAGPATWQPAAGISGMVEQADDLGIKARIDSLGHDATGLQELLLYGVKGAAAYADHAAILGYRNDEIYAFFHEALDYLANPAPTVDKLVALCLEAGRINLVTMELLDKAHTDTFGHPEPAEVRVTPVKGKAIVVSGHDLKDLEELLKATEGTGINIYTHGEMLPAHGYPALRKYPHLVGNYGGAWQDQIREFDKLPGAILMTTNCLQKPSESYKGRIFTSGLVAWPGVTHIYEHNYKPLIDAALAAEGFKEDAPEKKIMVGFGHNAVLGVADKVIDAVKAGNIRHFFLIGGCDGAKPGRNYYTELAEKVPDDCVILTLACGKYRFNKLEFGEIGGIPRMLDVGQCNDAYSAIKIAGALADAFGTDVNGLPLSLILSWYEQKAVAILLTLLHLGIRDIKIGPSLPAFITQPVLDVLVEKFNIQPVSTPDEDLATALAQA